MVSSGKFYVAIGKSLAGGTRQLPAETRKEKSLVCKAYLPLPGAGSSRYGLKPCPFAVCK